MAKMTNSEKYLKDGVDLADLLEKLNEDLNWFRYEEALKGASLDFIKFFNAEERKPTLTEDERVILRNIKNDDFGKYIGRGDVLSENRPRHFDLYLRGDSEYKAYAIGSMYNHLFQFIKERRRI